VETTRSISKVTANFFATLDVHASKLTQIVEENQIANEQKLSDLERKFEVSLAMFPAVLWTSFMGQL